MPNMWIKCHFDEQQTKLTALQYVDHKDLNHSCKNVFYVFSLFLMKHVFDNFFILQCFIIFF